MQPDQKVRQDGRLRYYAAADTVLAVVTPLARVKLCRISFGKDGSIYVAFPYLKKKRGLISRVTSPPAAMPIVYDLVPSGREVSTDVKFSHHASGIAQFSKTGSVAGSLRCHSFPLAAAEGRLFALHCYWLGGFLWLDTPRRRDLLLPFRFKLEHPFGVILEGAWASRKGIVDNSMAMAGSVGEHVGPVTEMIDRGTGQGANVVFLGQPPASPLQDHVIILSIRPVTIPDGADVPMMVFFGGAGLIDGATDGERRSSGHLIFMYPTGDGPRSE